MIQKNELRLFGILRMLSYQDITRVGIAVHVPVLKDHFSHSAVQHCSAFQGINSELFLGLCVVNPHPPHEFHCNDSLGAILREIFGNVDVIVICEVARSLKSVRDLFTKIELIF